MSMEVLARGSPTSDSRGLSADMRPPNSWPAPRPYLDFLRFVPESLVPGCLGSAMFISNLFVGVNFASASESNHRAHAGAR
jgi:hypothetical protein